MVLQVRIFGHIEVFARIVLRFNSRFIRGVGAIRSIHFERKNSLNKSSYDKSKCFN